MSQPDTGVADFIEDDPTIAYQIVYTADMIFKISYCHSILNLNSTSIHQNRTVRISLATFSQRASEQAWQSENI